MMKHDTKHSPRRTRAARHFLLLEAVSAVVLVLTVLSLAWIMVMAYEPTWLRLESQALEVIVVIVLFVAALLLVSLIALLHTRD